MRKIKKNEIKKVARIMAEGFYDYPLYSVFFPEDKKKLKRIFYFFWYRIYTRKNFTYITDDGVLAVSIQKPEDKATSPVGLILNPAFFFGFLANIPLKSLKLVSEFGKMEEPYWKKYYNPATDSYFQAICVLKKSRNGSLFFRAIHELDDGRPVFCETHTERNVKLYELLGMKVLDSTVWHGVTHYVMKRGAVENPSASYLAKPASATQNTAAPETNSAGQGENHG